MAQLKGAEETAQEVGTAHLGPEMTIQLVLVDMKALVTRVLAY